MRLRVAAGVGLLLAAATAAPAHAVGLFDLFMGGATPPAAPAPAEDGALTVHRRHVRRPAAPRVAHASGGVDAKDGGHKLEVSIDPTSVPDWYLRDRTLRRGDIVVLKSGVLVFTGHRDFARLRDARFLSAHTREFVAKATATNAYSAVAVAPPKPKVRPRAT